MIIKLLYKIENISVFTVFFFAVILLVILFWTPLTSKLEPPNGVFSVLPLVSTILATVMSI